jgi:hypothetical protein
MRCTLISVWKRFSRAGRCRYRTAARRTKNSQNSLKSSSCIGLCILPLTSSDIIPSHHATSLESEWQHIFSCMVARKAASAAGGRLARASSSLHLARGVVAVINLTSPSSSHTWIIRASKKRPSVTLFTLKSQGRHVVHENVTYT